jgi:hypothetical protein
MSITVQPRRNPMPVPLSQLTGTIHPPIASPSVRLVNATDLNGGPSSWQIAWEPEPASSARVVDLGFDASGAPVVLLYFD